MRRYHLLLLACCWTLFFVFASGQPEFNGDPLICTPDPSVSALDPNMPNLPNKAEFALERVEIRHIVNATLPPQLTLQEFIYDYDANIVIIVKSANGFVDLEYYYYNILKVSKYYQRQYCVVEDIKQQVDVDGSSAIQVGGIWHVRPIEQFLLFAKKDFPPIIPKYIGQGIVRGIPVDTWETCLVDKQLQRTIKRQWSFARAEYPMPVGTVNPPTAIPVQALINASIIINDTRVAEFDEVFNVLSWKPGIIETVDQLSPPKGVFCGNRDGNQELVTLSKEGIGWPASFSVRVDASSSREARWHTFHLRVDRNPERKRIRYDYRPAGAEHFETVVLDYRDNLRYIMDRQTGSCKILSGVEWRDYDPAANPMEFFLKYEKQIIDEPPENAWQYNGVRACRGSSIPCTIVTTLFEQFPPMIDSDTDKPTGETWDATNVEYAWSMRTPNFKPPEGTPRVFDYPVSLFMRSFKRQEGGRPFNIRTMDLEYEFYEMNYDVHAYEFDVSRCHRARDLPYLHLAFQVTLDKPLIDGNHLNRHSLEDHVRRRLHASMEPISWNRITELEIDHDNATNIVFILFTLLGPTPAADPAVEGGTAPTPPPTNELLVEAARDRLGQAIDSNGFTFDMESLDPDKTRVKFTAIPKSLVSSRKFLSSHAYALGVVGGNPTEATNIGSTTPITVPHNKWSANAEAGAVIGGLLVGLLLGIVVIAIYRVARKEPMPNVPGLSSLTTGVSNVGFYKTRTPAGGPVAPSATSNSSDA